MYITSKLKKKVKVTFDFIDDSVIFETLQHFNGSFIFGFADTTYRNYIEAGLSFLYDWVVPKIAWPDNPNHILVNGKKIVGIVDCSEQYCVKSIDVELENRFLWEIHGQYNHNYGNRRTCLQQSNSYFKLGLWILE